MTLDKASKLLTCANRYPLGRPRCSRCKNTLGREVRCQLNALVTLVCQRPEASFDGRGRRPAEVVRLSSVGLLHLLEEQPPGLVVLLYFSLLSKGQVEGLHYIAEPLSGYGATDLLKRTGPHARRVLSRSRRGRTPANAWAAPRTRRRSQTADRARTSRPGGA